MLAEASKFVVAKDHKFKKSNFLESPGLPCSILRVIDTFPLFSFETVPYWLHVYMPAKAFLCFGLYLGCLDTLNIKIRLLMTE